MSYQFPESPVFYRSLSRPFVKIVAGSGVYLIAEDGRRFLDASSGAMVANVGHAVPEIAAAVAAQIGRVAYVNGTQFTNDAVEELAAELAEVLPPPLRYSYFLSSGSEAVEAAVKLARQYFFERGETKRWKIVSRVPSYHGNTLTALSLSGREHYRKVYGPLLTEFPRVPAPDRYRLAQNHPAVTGDVFEEELLRQDPETIAAILIEPIIGSSLGAMVPGAEYHARVSEICKKYGILLIADEVLTGIGRTGKWFAAQHDRLAPDIMTLGKGLNGGAAPLSAVVTTEKIAGTLARGSGYFNHAQTYSHTPVICAAGVATLRYVKNHGLVERAAELEAEFFRTISQSSRIVGDVRGKGLLAGIELVADRTTKEPFPRSARMAERLTAKALEQNLIVWPNVGHAGGQNGDLIMIAPPLVISRDELTELGNKLSSAFSALEAEL